MRALLLSYDAIIKGSRHRMSRTCSNNKVGMHDVNGDPLNCSLTESQAPVPYSIFMVFQRPWWNLKAMRMP